MDNQHLDTAKKTITHPAYAGFWLRFTATVVDSLLLTAIILPILLSLYGPSYLLNPASPFSWGNFIVSYILPIMATLIFWKYRSATPGKMVFSLIIVDANTLQQPSLKQFIIRYFAYLISTLPLCLGFLWIAFDSRKQGWHDKIANTLVIHKPQ